MEERKQQFVEEFGEEGANRRAVCRAYGISAKAGYALWNRYRREGEAAVQERSRRPWTSPQRLGGPLEERIVELREAKKWGPRKIRWKLGEEGGWPVPARSTISQVLKRHGLVSAERSRQSRAHERFEYAAPNQLWQMDFKGDFALRDGGRCYPLAILDDHSRFLVDLHACADQRGATVRERLRVRFREYGLPERMLMDNGPPWGTAGAGGYTALEVWLMRLEVDPIHGRPYHPQTQGKVERLNRTVGEELELDFGDLSEAQRGFAAYRPGYNEERPHEGVGMEVPARRYRASERAYPEELAPVEYESGDEVRRVGQEGRISYRGRVWRIGKAFARERVALRPSEEEDGWMQVYFCRRKIGELDLASPACPEVLPMSPGHPFPFSPGHARRRGGSVLVRKHRSVR